MGFPNGQRKDVMQQELDELHAGLQEQNADIGQASLFDNEGFPRADIDVYNVRLTRVCATLLQLLHLLPSHLRVVHPILCPLRVLADASSS